ncbi:MAG: hypothetical protein GY899_08135 [Verrucomicrobiaceae bacterium]|nr:hypothetical protein [Verrucomicrobiaceae bacterium]
MITPQSLYCRTLLHLFLCLSCACFQIEGKPLLSPGDFIIAIDEDFSSRSSSPVSEEVANAIDGNVNTKYLNFGRQNSGVIVTPASGAAAVQSFRLTTANDEPPRDPAAFAIYGTNDQITSTNHSAGNAETWTLVASGERSLPDARFSTAPIVSFGNNVSYSSYCFLVTGLKDEARANSMQFSEIEFFTQPDGQGQSVLAPGDRIIAVHRGSPESSSPVGEEAFRCIDGNTGTKYLNLGRENSGFIVTPGIGRSAVSGFTITTANDFSGRDPVSWELFATNDRIRSVEHSEGKSEQWVPVASGSLTLPSTRFAKGDPVTFNNSTSYASYKFLVRAVKSGAAVVAVQFSEIQFEGNEASGTGLEINSVLYDRVAKTITLSWASEPGQTYTLFYSPDLTNWELDVDDSILSGGEVTSFGPFNVINPGSSTGFYRVQRN